ncbi:MAG: 3-deoxy-manno-octulosonate cytidylyltransferase [Bacteroidetes bacterium]|nr:3-deoxy-manno-octulosonate cytidylyltransferase [Bacteroidota bacterium]
MRVVGIIPARYASTRLPGKPLADLGGKTLIKRVYENSLQFGLDHIIVATDDQRIANEIPDHSVLTPADLESGTVRTAWVAKNIEADVVINIQGDEPFVHPGQIESLKKAFQNEEVEIATLCYQLKSLESLKNPATVKVVFNSRNQALYFSRSPIPFVRNVEEANWLSTHTFYKHIGIYAYRAETLQEIIKFSGSSLEKAESLEQLAWLENGFNIQVVETDKECFSIDTPQDLEKARTYIKQQAIQ